ncbi:MAG: hypothetical protein NXI01_08380 [Gammaproteobacteria bacterium]|nr:hypothetical protein [Gammaproteobacteria bacterium]
MPSNHDLETISRQFPTTKYKRFWYPTRPVLTLALGIFLASLGYFGILPMAWALWAAAAFAFDDLPLTPIMAMFTAVNNLMEGRKMVKAIAMIMAITLAVLVGGYLGYAVFAHNPMIVKGVTDYIAETSCSPLLISLGAILGGGAAHYTRKVSPFVGFMLGILIASFLPIPVPLVVEITYLSVAVLAFVASVVTKQVLRAYYYLSYGHSNADGYEVAKASEQQKRFIQEQSRNFGVSEDIFLGITEYCREEITKIKQGASYLQEFAGNRTPVTNSYKNICYGLMKPNPSPEEVEATKQLIACSNQLSEEDNTDANKAMAQMSVFTVPGQARLTLAHQLNINANSKLPEKYVTAFAP